MQYMTEERRRRPRGGGWRRRARCCRCSRYLEQHPEGVRADDVAHVVGKSGSTAYYLLASLVEEGFAIHDGGGLYRPRRATRRAPRGPSLAHALEDAVDDLFLRTHKRCYLGVVRNGRDRDRRSCAAARGSRRCPGSARRSPTTPTRWRWARSCSRACAPTPSPATPPAGSSATRRTRSPTLRRAQRGARAGARRTASPSTARSSTPTSAASPRPCWTTRGRLAGILGLSASTRAFDAEHERALPRPSASVADGGVDDRRFQHRAETHDFLHNSGTGSYGPRIIALRPRHLEVRVVPAGPYLGGRRP